MCAGKSTWFFLKLLVCCNTLDDRYQTFCTDNKKDYRFQKKSNIFLITMRGAIRALRWTTKDRYLIQDNRPCEQQLTMKDTHPVKSLFMNAVLFIPSFPQLIFNLYSNIVHDAYASKGEISLRREYIVVWRSPQNNK